MTPPAFGLLAKRPIPDAVSDTYVLPCLSDPAVLRDASKAMRSASIAPLRSAAARLVAEFRRPVLLAWAAEDPVFPLAGAHRYAAELSNGRLAVVEDAYGFLAEDQPAALAATISDFARTA
jgi:pimeloyl-ACP methyl ester carboxylesterase